MATDLSAEDRVCGLTQTDVLARFEYRNGELYWKPMPRESFKSQRAWEMFNCRHAGKRAGAPTDGYLRVHFKPRYASVHRLVFLMFHGYVPPMLDHINGDSMDNRIENLRPVTLCQNQHNAKMPVTNTSGFKGVSRSGSSWIATIRVNGKQHHLGSFKTKEAAIAIRIAATEKYHGEFARL